MAQIISIYGLVASVIISNNLIEKMALHTAFLQLGAGLAVGLCGLAAGFAIGIIGDAGGQHPLSLSPPLFLFPSPLVRPSRSRTSPPVNPVIIITPRHEWDIRWDRMCIHRAD